MCLVLLIRLVTLFSGLIVSASAQGMLAPQVVVIAYSPSHITMAGVTGTAAIFAALFCILTGARLKRRLAIVGVITLRGKIMGVSKRA